MEITGAKERDLFIVKVKGRMDSATASEFEKACNKWIDAGENSFVIDFGELEYISSAGLRSILVVAKRLKSSAGKICFCALTRMVKEVFTITGFSSMFCIHDSLAELFEKA